MIIQGIPAGAAKITTEMCQLESNLEDAGHAFLAKICAKTVFDGMVVVDVAVGVVRRIDRAQKTQRLWKRGHCTTACGCCVRTQKSQKDGIAMQRDLEDFPFDFGAFVTLYSQRMYLAYGDLVLMMVINFLDSRGLSLESSYCDC